MFWQRVSLGQNLPVLGVFVHPCAAHSDIWLDIFLNRSNLKCRFTSFCPDLWLVPMKGQGIRSLRECVGGCHYQAGQPRQAYREAAKRDWEVSLGASLRMPWGWQPEQQGPIILLSNSLCLLQGSRSLCAASSCSPYPAAGDCSKGSPKGNDLGSETSWPPPASC